MKEYYLLQYFIDYMERNGLIKEAVIFDLDQQLCDELNEWYKQSFTLPELQKSVDKCIANEWLKHRGLNDKYSYLGITTSGVGIIRSRRNLEQKKKSRTVLKNIG